MKKILFFLFLLSGVTVSAQTILRTGLEVGRTANRATIDSITETVTGDTLLFWNAGDTVFVFGAGGSGSMTYPGAGIALSSGSAWSASITNNSTNWNTAYTDRLKWDGGATGLVAATGRTSLGATTVGKALFMVPTPVGISFLRINADSTLSTLSAADFKTALSLGNVTNESKATMFTSPTFTGTPVIASPFTLGATSVTANGTELNVLDNIPGTLTSTELGYVDGVTSAIQTQINGLSGSTDSTFVTATGDTIRANTIITPDADGGAALGDGLHGFSDLFFDTTAVINFNNGDVTLTHTSNTLTLAGGNLALGSNNLTITGTGTATSPKFYASGAVNPSGPLDASGYQIKTVASTITDSFTPGTRALVAANGFATPTFAGDNSITITNAATLYIATAPAAGTNMTITNPYSLYTADGNTYLADTTKFQAGINIGDAKIIEAELEVLDGVPATLTSTELGYVDGVTSGIQTQFGTKLNKADSALMAGGYGSYYDLITGLALKSNIASPTFTGTVIIPSPFTLGATSVTANGTELNVLDNIPGTLTSTELGYVDGVTSAIQTQLNAINAELDDTFDIETTITLQSDTVPLFVFLGGGGNAGDTTSFTTSTVYGSYRVHDTTIITSINAVMIAGTTPLGTDTLGIQIYFNDSINVTTGGSVRLLNAATLGINSVTTGTVDASFANNTIYPGERVFMKSPGVVVGRIPIYVEVTTYGYIQNRAY